MQGRLFDVGVRAEPLAWHYTPADTARLILDCGTIEPHGEAPIPPAVWFSRNPVVERSATGFPVLGSDPLGVREGGTLMTAGTYARFALPRRKLKRFWSLRWQMDHLMGLALTGQAIGANPDEWLVSLLPVPVSLCAVEVWDGLRWSPGQPASSPEQPIPGKS